MRVLIGRLLSRAAPCAVSSWFASINDKPGQPGEVCLLLVLDDGRRVRVVMHPDEAKGAGRQLADCGARAAQPSHDPDLHAGDCPRKLDATAACNCGSPCCGAPR